MNIFKKLIGRIEPIYYPESIEVIYRFHTHTGNILFEKTKTYQTDRKEQIKFNTYNYPDIVDLKLRFRKYLSENYHDMWQEHRSRMLKKYRNPQTINVNDATIETGNHIVKCSYWLFVPQKYEMSEASDEMREEIINDN